MEALLLIGFQNDLLPGGNEEVPGSSAAVAVLENILPIFEHIIQVMYWFQPTSLLFAANHLWRKPGQIIGINSHPIKLSTMYCIQNSFGAEAIPSIPADRIHETFLLGTSDDLLLHSAFAHAGAQGDTGLESYLTVNKIDTITIAGLPLETLVKETALRAATLGLKVSIVRDACAAKDKSAANSTIEALKEKGIGIPYSPELTGI